MTPLEKRQYLATFQRFQKNREIYFAPSIYQALRQQYADYKYYGNVDKISSRPITEALRPLYLDAGIVYGAKVRAMLNAQKARMPIGFNERMVQLMNEYFRTDILNVAEGITETTKSLIQAVLQKAVENGYGIDWIVKELDNTEVSRIRSRLIARTETVTAANQGALFAAKDMGLKLNKEWLATFDDRTRHDHSIVNGQIVGVDDYFTLDNSTVTMKIPGARTQKNGLEVPAKEVVNCRCTTLFLPVRDSRGNLLN